MLGLALGELLGEVLGLALGEADGLAEGDVVGALVAETPLARMKVASMEYLNIMIDIGVSVLFGWNGVFGF